MHVDTYTDFFFFLPHLRHAEVLRVRVRDLNLHHSSDTAGSLTR